MLRNRDAIVVATRNPGKAKEFARLFEPLGVAVRSLNDFERVPDVVEDGATFAENALKKAKTVALSLRLPALADDSGLCVDALQGRPGVYSARFAGERATDAQNNAKLLEELRALAEQGAIGAVRTEVGGMQVRVMSAARFVCALALFDPATGQAVEVEDHCPGYVIDTPLGEGGFGYDPLFYLPERGRTMAQLTAEQKNEISHRAKAMKRLLERLGLA